MHVKSSEIKTGAQRWFRFYAESVNDPKVQKLPPHLFKTWVNILCLACSSGGVLPHRDDIAFQLRMSDHDAQSQIDELIGLGLLDLTPEKALEPHNWKQRQFVSDSSAERTRKYRKKKAKPSCDVTRDEVVTAPEQSRAESETEQIPPTPEGDKPPTNVTPIKNWSQAFTSADEAPAVIRTEAGSIQLAGTTRQLWLEKFGGNAARLDAALLEVAGAINDGSRKPLAADVQGRLGRIVGNMLDRERSYQTAVAANAAAKAMPKPVKLSRW